MTGLFSAVAARSATRSARSVLNGLMAAVGAAGLDAARVRPGLLAAIDQHAAAVRDSLFGDLRQMTVVHLAGYADGVREAAMEHGWRLPDGPVDWSTCDWVTLRLLAVCALAPEAALPS